MSDLGKLDIGDWLAVGVTSTIAGIGAAMGWFKSSNNKRDKRTEAIENSMRDYERVRATQATQLAVLETCQANIQEKLEEIKDDIQRSAERGAHSVNSQLAAVLSEVQKVAANQQRRG